VILYRLFLPRGEFTMHQLFMNDYITEMYENKSLEEHFQVYEKYVGLLGFDAAIYTFVSNISIGKNTLPSIFLRTANYSSDFLEHYVTEDLDQCDFTVKRIKDHKMSIMDWREYQLTKPITKEESELITLAREEYNFKNSLSIPLMNRDIGGAGVSIISSEKDSTFAKLKAENLETLLHCTQLFHDINFLDIQKLPLSILTFLSELSEKERGILTHLASGEQFKNIEYSIDVASYKVASNILDRLRGKFDTKITRTQLMFLVGILGVLSV